MAEGGRNPLRIENRDAGISPWATLPTAMTGGSHS